MKISNNKNILSGESEKNISNKVKSLINRKSTFITKKDLMIWKHVERVIFCFQILLLQYVIFIRKELPVVLVDNNIDTDRTFNAIWGSILTWENSELKNELKLSRAKIQTLLSKLYF